eukprot:CAMPEP_0113635018 /NCGR_PEP_ID=MMETSP0017_2-20120614/18244_1 /TAXON_ID=2856 /ORGANISM="Cylindrotheca closterium" /LENGTH=234 /DNA_ID=CAMNT_0000545761 /DNA_START=162 /DNA_END=866 /DNA_ORIENTATION=+ /assembly_acc=CAM_ASM_000147
MASKSPGSNPLEVIKKGCLQRNLCDEHGYRRPGIHWTFSIAVSPDDPTQPPNLRTVGVQRVSEDGIDFIMKKGCGTCDFLASGKALSILHLQGRYMPGETVEQWRGEGVCETRPLNEIIDKLPTYSLVAMLSSKSIEHEKGALVEELKDKVSGKRLAMENKSHMTELIQSTRLALENGEISDETLDESIQVFRFRPSRLECMIGGPDSVLWNRWEWQTNGSGDDWNPAKALLPH